MHVLNLLFSFHGRINRAQYWLGGLGAGFLGTLATFVAAFIVAPHNGVKPDPMAQMLLTLGAFAPVMFAMTWAGLSIQVKRFHDRNRSGWFALAPLIPGLVMTSTLIGGVLVNAPAEIIVPKIVPWLGLSGLINLAVFVDLGLMPGVAGSNRFGDPPGSSPTTQFKPQGSPPAPSTLDSAASALDRAIAQRKTPHLAAAPKVMPAPAPTRAPGPATFGRRATS